MTALGEDVSLGFERGMIIVASARGATWESESCNQVDSTSVECLMAPVIVVNFLGFNVALTTDALSASVHVEAHAGAGDDRLNGALAGDRLYGDLGDDAIDGKAGADLLEGREGNDTITGDRGQIKCPALAATTRSRADRGQIESPAVAATTRLIRGW